MTSTTPGSRAAGRPWLRRRGAVLAAGTLLLAGCDGLLDVTDPTVVDPASLQTEQGVPASLAAAVGNFQHAFSGSPGGGSYIDNQITISGILADEFYVSESFTTRIDVDQRATEFTNATMQAAYARLHAARRMSEESARLHARFEATANTAGHAHALNLAGFTYLLFGENYCSGVPFSEILEGGASIEFGEPQTTTQIFQRALDHFDQALAAATAAGDGAAAVQQQDLARVGRARALLNLDRPAEAALAVAAVPTGFAYTIGHSTASLRQQNGIWAGNLSQKRASVSDREGGNGLPFRSVGDPRVPTDARGVGFDNATPFFDQFKYPTNQSNVVLASGVEARLVEAEHQLRSGGDWLGTLNALRSSPPAYYPAAGAPGQASFPGIDTLEPLTDPGSAAARVDLLFRERAFWMFLTSHRVGDLRRLMRQYGRDQAGAGWPTGTYFRGDVYGDHVSVLVPFDELNNPRFREQFPQGCDPSIP